MTNFDFFKIRFLGFYKADEIRGHICTQKGQGFHTYPFVDF